MEIKHTPGPWQVVRPSVGVDANWHVTDKDDTFVAHVYGFGHAVDEQSLNNARLIAAAPELFKNLVDLIECIETAIRAGDWKVDGACDPDLSLRRSLKSISKVLGEQHGSKQA